MLPPGARVIAAVSGGADSVCLAHILRQIGAKLAGLAHFNHGLRGAESDADERLAAALAASFGVPFYRAGADLRSAPGNLEQAARNARREFFLNLIAEGAGDRIATGHTRDDQAETVLFRILRGSGLAGIAGIHPVTDDGLIRPLLEVSREEIRDYLREHGIEWREDASNLDERFARNRIRRDLLPQLRREWNPRIDDALANLADLAFEEHRIWETGYFCLEPPKESAKTPALRPRLSRGPVYKGAAPVRAGQNCIEFPASILAEMPRGPARRVLRNAIAQIKGDLRQIELHHVDGIVELASRPGGAKLSIPGLQAIRSFDSILLGTPPPPLAPIEAAVPGTYALPGDSSQIRLEIAETPDPGCANLKVELAAPIVLRGWRPGDHYRPVGRSRDTKLKQLFQDARVPSWRRAAWPILEYEGQILWTRQFGPACEFAARGGGPLLRVWDVTR